MVDSAFGNATRTDHLNTETVAVGRIGHAGCAVKPPWSAAEAKNARRVSNPEVDRDIPRSPGDLSEGGPGS